MAGAGFGSGADLASAAGLASATAALVLDLCSGDLCSAGLCSGFAAGVSGWPFESALESLFYLFRRYVLDGLFWIFEIACQISLTPRPVTAEHSSSSPAYP